MSNFGTQIDYLNDKTVKGYTHYFIHAFFVIAALTSMVSCEEKKPEGILTKQQMLQTMEEIYIAEEKVNHLGLSRDSAKKVFEAMKVKVFQDAGASDSVFRKSFDYYMEHPGEMELIYTALVDTMQLREQRAPLRVTNP